MGLSASSPRNQLRQILTSSQVTFRRQSYDVIQPASSDAMLSVVRNLTLQDSAGWANGWFLLFRPIPNYEEKMLAPSSNHHPKVSLYTWSIFKFLAIVLLNCPDIWEMNIQLQDRKENRPTYHKKQFWNNSRHGSITDVQFHIIKLVWQLISSANIIVCVVGKTLSGSLALHLSGNINTHLGPSSLCEIATLRYISHF